ncbi:transmembrane protein, putative [Talaromyces stipitatus ATCC 10500]|uniref:Transmembrane protein, putative n=1 Tax=Talaromyces stipitatus (strain ATCC 10500 / CBS 375.48 / QM 6759 / NRRL 1006) TaxID=441959 RepID=B8M1E0_TALSN|nr:uncharacterized protein TSTA_090760 [Talaromyces stipitatus ATCC 10500]EED21836.1 transmembrane protein, putative [Talaromyces stipitatus ATCC 10500]
MRLCLIIPVYSIVSFLCICFPNAYVYLDTWLDVVQGDLLTTFFLLLCDYISTDPYQREAYLAKVDLPLNKKTQQPVDAVAWYQKTWLFIIQYPIASFICAVATDITQASKIYCLGSDKPYFAHLWIEIVANISVTLAIMNTLKFFMGLKVQLAGIDPMVKFLAFKVIVGFNFLISLIFLILRSTKVLSPSSTLTWADINIGLPTLIICLLMVPFSLFFHYAYSIKPYRLSKIALEQAENGRHEPFTPLQYQGGLFNFRMWLSVFSPLDLVRGFQGRRVQSDVAREPLRGQGEELYDMHNPLLYARG